MNMYTDIKFNKSIARFTILEEHCLIQIIIHILPLVAIDPDLYAQWIPTMVKRCEIKRK